MTLKLFNPNGRTCPALVLLSFGYTLSPEHWLCFPRLASLLLLTGPEIFTGFFPFGASAAASVHLSSSDSFRFHCR
jgi:hypothetical protein